MANQVIPRLRGDDYQHLHSWFLVLELKMPTRMAKCIAIESSDAGSFDDVTIERTSDSAPSTFCQIKYHVDHRDAYSTDMVIAHKTGCSSLLQKFLLTFKHLNALYPNSPKELHLISNWTWSSQDKFRDCISGHDNSIKDDFWGASEASDLGKIRRKWADHLGINGDELRMFITSLRFRLGFDNAFELEQRIRERMMHLSMKCDEAAMLLATGIIRKWIMNGPNKISLSQLEDVIAEHKLALEPNAERSIAVYMSTIKSGRFEIEPDYTMDWRHLFEGQHDKGHKITNETDWNSTILPDMYQMAERINHETACKVIRARGYARLSAWFGFGYVFSEVAGYALEVDQNGAKWRTDQIGASDLDITVSGAQGFQGETIRSSGSTVAVGVSITGSLENDVMDYVTTCGYDVAAVLLLKPNRPLGRECLKSPEDTNVMSDRVKELMRSFVKHRKATRLLLFYFGPLSGACFIGHRLNAVCNQVQIMEDQQPGYSPSLLLS